MQQCNLSVAEKKNANVKLGSGRREICHKHHKQRLCKIISIRVKFHFVSVHLEQFVYVSCGFCGNLKVLR